MLDFLDLPMKIQYHKLKKYHNTNQIKSELRTRELEQYFDETTGWLKLIKILKDNEGDKKYSHSLNTYNSFKWSSSHFDDDGTII